MLWQGARWSLWRILRMGCHGDGTLGCYPVSRDLSGSLPSGIFLKIWHSWNPWHVNTIVTASSSQYFPRMTDDSLEYSLLPRKPMKWGKGAFIISITDVLPYSSRIQLQNIVIQQSSRLVPQVELPSAVIYYTGLPLRLPPGGDTGALNTRQVIAAT